LKEVGESTRREIEKRTRIVLLDAGITEPPVNVQDLLDSLRLYRHFYDLESPQLLRRFAHRLHVGGRKILKIVKKIKLMAVLLQNEDQIFIDSSLHELKKIWASYHEILHKILPWHKPFFIGDTAQTLDPVYQERLELEANYGASELMFCGDVFTEMALDTSPCWESIELLKKECKTSFPTTTRRYVEHSHEIPMAAFISTPYWMEKEDEQPERWRHFIKSSQFKKKFSSVSPEQIVVEVEENTRRRRWGIVGDYIVVLEDDNSELHEFHAESFFNHYDIITLMVYHKKI